MIGLCGVLCLRLFVGAVMFKLSSCRSSDGMTLMDRWEYLCSAFSVGGAVNAEQSALRELLEP